MYVSLVRRCEEFLNRVANAYDQIIFSFHTLGVVKNPYTKRIHSA
jgi:hypothetical protein